MVRSRAAAVLLALVAGCGKKDSSDKVFNVAADDPRMNAAMEQARSTVNVFITALKAPKAGQSDFSIKMAFTEGERVEHMWLSPVRFDGRKFYGTVNNDPEAVRNVRIGQEVSVEPSKISDWMFVENRKLVGGYTLRVLRQNMTAAERAEFDKNMPFTVD